MLLNCELTSWESISKTQHIKEGHKLNKPQHLFEQISDEIINQEIEKLNINYKQALYFDSTTDQLTIFQRHQYNLRLF